MKLNDCLLRQSFASSRKEPMHPGLSAAVATTEIKYIKLDELLNAGIRITECHMSYVRYRIHVHSSTKLLSALVLL